MGIFSSLTRRTFMQRVAGGAAIAAGSRIMRAGNARAQNQVVLPSGGKKFESIELTYLQDSSWLHAPLWLSPAFMKEAGVGIKSRELYEGAEAMQKVLPQFLAKQSSFDWVEYPCPFFGGLAETGQLEPLDDYFARYEDSKEYLDWVMPGYGEFYTRWNGKTYGVMLDGNIHVLHYRKSRFADPDLQKKFSTRFQRELQVPKTWPEFIDCAQFFTEELSGQGIYGTSMVVNPPSLGWAFWMDIAAGNGVDYFDEGMTPTINTMHAVEALDLFREIIKWGPPGKEAMTSAQTIQRWQSGADVMSIWGIELAKFTVPQQGPERAEDQGADIVPGWKQADGTISYRAVSLWCRAASIPKNVPQNIKDAAFHFIYRMSHPSVSDYIVADPYCGSNPFGASHYSDASAQLYLKPNPQRGTDNELWPSNDGIFKNFATAREHLDGGLKNIQVAYPQLYWEGAPEYAEALGRSIARAVAGELTSQQALDQAAEEWTKIVQRLGIDKQKVQYANFLAGARKLGYKI